MEELVSEGRTQTAQAAPAHCWWAQPQGWRVGPGRRGVLVGLGGYLQDAILGVFPPIPSLKYLHPMLVYP